MKEYTRDELHLALAKAYRDPEAYEILTSLIDQHVTMVNHMKHTSLWDVMSYEENLTSLLKTPMEVLKYDNEKLKKEVNKLRKQLGMIEKYKEEDDVSESRS